jgi:hypothetical protein
VTGLSNWKLHGPVKALRTELAEWDIEMQQWRSPRHRTLVSFDRRGQVTSLDQPGAGGSVQRTTFVYNSDGWIMEESHGTAGASVERTTSYFYDAAGRLEQVVDTHPEKSDRTLRTVYEYDASGRKKKIEFLPAETSGISMCYGVEGSEIGYGVPGAATLTTLYDDDGGQPTQAEFRDATQAVLRTVTFTRDDTGRVVAEEAKMDGAGPAHLQGAFAQLPDEDAAKAASMLRAAFGSIVTTFTYDADGRLLERRRHMGGLSDERTTFLYDARGNSIEESTDYREREMSMDENDGIRYTADRVRTSATRFEYTYDARGNWTERVVWARFEPGAEFCRSNVERRAIQYFTE